MKDPYFKFYPNDYLADPKVAMMTYAEKGMYVDLLCYQWSNGPLPADLKSIARMLKIPYMTLRAAWERIGKCFTMSGDGKTMYQGRLERERLKATEYREKQRENGKKGGRPTEGLDNPSLFSEEGLGLPNESQEAENSETQDKAKKSPRVCARAIASLSLSDSITGSSASAKDPGEEPISSPPPFPETVPTKIPSEIPDLRELAKVFMVAFGNCSSAAAQKRHGPGYVDALAICAQRGATTRQAWDAFAKAREAQDGKPLFAASAKKCLTYLPNLRRNQEPAKEKPVIYLDKVDLDALER